MWDKKAPATVAELIKFLSQFPGDMILTEQRYSDMKFMSLDDWRTEEGIIRDRGGYVEVVSKEKVESYYRQYANDPVRLAKLGIAKYTPEEVKKFVFYHGN